MKDLIDRQAALDTFGPWLNVEGYSEGELNMLRAVLYELKTLPTAQPERKTEEIDKDTNVPGTDCISRQQAIDALWEALFEYEDKTEKQFQESEDLDVGDWFAHRIFVQNMSDIDRQTILNLPAAQPEVSRIEQELHGKTPEEQYEFLYWLLLRFALAYTDSRLAVVEWLRGEKEYERHNQQTGSD